MARGILRTMNVPAKHQRFRNHGPSYLLRR